MDLIPEIHTEKLLLADRRLTWFGLYLWWQESLEGVEDSTVGDDDRSSHLHLFLTFLDGDAYQETTG